MTTTRPRLGMSVVITGTALILSLAMSEISMADTEEIQLSAAATYDRYGKIDENVRKKCDIAGILNRAVANANANVVLTSEPKESSRRLEVHIFHLVRGGIVGVRGKLIERNVVVASFSGSRSFQNDQWAYLGAGTCGRLSRIATRVGSDVAAFLRRPGLEAKIGDL